MNELDVNICIMKLHRFILLWEVKMVNIQLDQRD